MTYEVKTKHFEGPLDLLLTLIEEQKLDVTRVSLAHVADQYLAYMNAHDDISLYQLAEFLSVAAKLILIKSKALLPLLEFSKDEEDEIKDLEWQLVEFAKFKGIAKDIAQMYNAPQHSVSRKAFANVDFPFAPPENFSLDDLRRHFLSVLTHVPLVEKLEEQIVADVMSLEQKIVHVQNMVRQRAQMSFAQMTENAKDKTEVVISFLALLELVKQRIVSAEQHGIFGDIQIQASQQTAYDTRQEHGHERSAA